MAELKRQRELGKRLYQGFQYSRPHTNTFAMYCLQLLTHIHYSRGLPSVNATSRFVQLQRGTKRENILDNVIAAYYWILCW